MVSHFWNLFHCKLSWDYELVIDEIKLGLWISNRWTFTLYKVNLNSTHVNVSLMGVV